MLSLNLGLSLSSGGVATFDPAALSGTWGAWDPNREATLSGADVTALPDLSGNSRDLTYNATSGVSAIQTISGKDWASMPSSGNTDARFDNTAFSIADGTNQAWTVWGTFYLDNLTPIYHGLFSMRNSATATANHIDLYVQNTPLLRLDGWNSSGARTRINISITPAATTRYSYVLRCNGDGTIDAWANGAKVNTSTAFAPGAINGIDGLGFGARLRGPVVVDELQGDIGAGGVSTSALSDGDCVAIAGYLHTGWSE